MGVFENQMAKMAHRDDQVRCVDCGKVGPVKEMEFRSRIGDPPEWCCKSRLACAYRRDKVEA